LYVNATVMPKSRRKIGFSRMVAECVDVRGPTLARESRHIVAS
jgi:hypothetical protein